VTRTLPHRVGYWGGVGWGEVRSSIKFVGAI